MSLANVSEHGDLVEQLARDYSEEGWNIVAREKKFPENSPQPIGQVDLIVEDEEADRQRFVEATYTESLNAEDLENYLESNLSQLDKARDFFGSQEGYELEAVIGTGGALKAVRDIWGQLLRDPERPERFKMDEASGAVSETSYLGSLKQKGYMVLDYDASREANREIYELSPRLDPVIEVMEKIEDEMDDVRLYP